MQMRISDIDIEWYIRKANIFGTAVKKLAHYVENTTDVLNHKKIDFMFEKYTTLISEHDTSYVFQNKKNSLNELFNYKTCVSVNNCIAHGISNEINKNDIVTVDCGISLQAPSGRHMYFDSAITIMHQCNYRTHSYKELIEAPINAMKEIVNLEGAINTRQLSKIIERVGVDNNFGIIAELCGHGIGYELHEAPTITNMTHPLYSIDLLPGTFICPEPMYTLNNSKIPANVYLKSDGWSVVSEDISSHCETILHYDGKKLTDVCNILT